MKHATFDDRLSPGIAARFLLVALLVLLGAGGVYYAWTHRERREEPPRARLVHRQVQPAPSR